MLSNSPIQIVAPNKSVLIAAAEVVTPGGAGALVVVVGGAGVGAGVGTGVMVDTVGVATTVDEMVAAILAAVNCVLMLEVKAVAEEVIVELVTVTGAPVMVYCTVACVLRRLLGLSDDSSAARRAAVTETMLTIVSVTSGMEAATPFDNAVSAAALVSNDAPDD